MVSLVKYRYPEEEIQQIEGDNYSIDTEYINTTEWQAAGEATVLKIGSTQPKAGWFSTRTFTEKEGEINKFDTHNLFKRKTGEHWFVGNSSCRVAANSIWELWRTREFSAPPSRLGDSRTPSLAYSKNPEFEPENKTYYYDNPIITHWHPVNGEREITFKIFLNDSEVFTRVEIEKPPAFVQIIEGRECPPETCPVSCGDQICCYASNGISVDSFLKAESIY